MQTTLRLDDEIYREAKAEAARTGVTLTSFIEAALSERIRKPSKERAIRGRKSSPRESEIEERNRLMESLLQRTAHFRIGRKPTRSEMNER